MFVKINDTLYPATISGKVIDKEWDNRSSKSITLEMDYAIANELFVNGAIWSIVDEVEADDGTIQTVEWDNSEYNLAGDLTDHRDGTITVKMGKLTELEEAYEIMLGGI